MKTKSIFHIQASKIGKRYEEQDDYSVMDEGLTYYELKPDEVVVQIQKINDLFGLLLSNHTKSGNIST